MRNLSLVRMTPEALRLRSQVGILSRYGRLEEASDARRALAVAVAEADLADLVETHSPTAEQRARLAAVLSCSPMEASADERTNGGRPGIAPGSTAAH